MVEAVSQVRGREDQNDAPALLDRVLELQEAGPSQGEGRLGVDPDATLLEGVEEVTDHPRAVGLRVGNEHVVRLNFYSGHRFAFLVEANTSCCSPRGRGRESGEGNRPGVRPGSPYDRALGPSSYRQ